MQNKYKYLIFDLDGTLLDTDLYVVSNYAHLFLKYKPHEMKRLAVQHSMKSLKENFQMFLKKSYLKILLSTL